MPMGLDAITEQNKKFARLGFERSECPVSWGDAHCRIPYWIIPSDWSEIPAGAPKNFAMRLTPSLNSLQSLDLSVYTVFGVSSDIPARFRESIARHEMWEFMAMPLAATRFVVESTDTIPGGCMAASVRELEAVLTGEWGQRDISDYIGMRSQYFNELVPFCMNSDPYSPLSIANCKESANFWKRYQQMLQ